MRTTVKILAAISLSVFSFIPLAADGTRSLILNELMQSSIDGPLDSLNEYPDGWIELYNPSSSPVNIKGYSIGKSSKKTECYTLPELILPAGGHCIIYCDKEDQVVSKSGVTVEIHTDFHLSNMSKGKVCLFEPGGELADRIDLQPMPAPNVAYGRISDGAETMGYMLTPTPNDANSGGIARMVLPDPVFSTTSIIVEAQGGSGTRIRLKASLPKDLPSDAIIRYTTDGSEPTTDSPEFPNTLYFTGNTILKAAIFADSCITPPAANRVFIFHGRRITLPVISMVTPPENLYDPKIGIIANNKSTDSDKRYNWRRPVIMDYFPLGSSNAKFTQRCEIRVSGAWSRANDQKSLIAYANSRFGSKDWFTAQFWPYTNPDMLYSPSISLRDGGNDFGNSNMRDGISQMAFGMYCDLDWQGFQPAIIYINGRYDGLLNIRERGNEDNIWMHYNRLEDITLLENPSWGGAPKKGDINQYYEFRNFVRQSGHTLQEFEERMDVIEYTNMMLCHIYMGNHDFPSNNYVMWRPRQEGGRWRWIVKDVDQSLGVWGHSAKEKSIRWILRDPADAIPDATANSEEDTRLLRQLMKTDDYRSIFTDRLSIYMGDFLTAAQVGSLISWAQDQMEYEMPYYKQVYSAISSYDNWTSELKRMIQWVRDRNESMYEQLQEYFGLGNPIPATINKGVASQSSYDISVNGIPLQTHMFDGKLFADREYTIRATYSNEAYQIAGWQIVRTTDLGEQIELRYEPDLTINLDDGLTSVAITAIRQSTGMGTPEEELMEPVSIRYCDLSGMESDHPFPGLNLIRYTYPDGSISVEKRLFGQ